MKTLFNKSNHSLIKAILLLSYAVYFILLRIFIIPFGDDQFWWGPAGRYLMEHKFFTLKNQSYIGGSSNGRYLSNLAMIYSMHHPIVFYLLFGVLSMLVVYLIYKLVSEKFLIFILALVLPFTLSKPFLSMTWLWFAAFINYISGLVFILGYILILKEEFIDKKEDDSLHLIIISLLLGLGGGLIVEHVTIYQVLLGIFAVSLMWLKNRQIRIYQIIYLAASLISAVIMFSNGSYWAQTEYRQVPFTISASVKTYVQSSHFWLISLNLFLVIVITCAVITLIMQKAKRSKLDYFQFGMSAGFLIYYLIVNAIFNRYFDLAKFIPDVSSRLQWVDSVVSIAFIGYLFVSIFIVTTNKTLRWMLLFCLVSFGILIGPFLVITQPNAAREFFIGVVFLYIYGLLLVNQVVFSKTWLLKVCQVSVLALLITGSTVIMVETFQNHQAYIQRTKDLTIPGAVAAKSRVPFPSLMPNGDLYTTHDSILYWKEYHEDTFKDRLWHFDYEKK